MRKYHIIHVNRQFIAMNAKDGGNRPVCTIKHKDGNTYYGHRVEIHGPSHIGNLGKQLSCGARVWIETESDITIINQQSFKEAKQVV